MLQVSVPTSHIAAIAVANFFLSWIWYSPLLFARPWMKALGLDPDRGMKDMSEAEKRKLPWLMLNGLVSSTLKALLLSVAVASLGAQSFGDGALIGALAWAGFILPSSLDTLWEGRKGLVLLINNALFVLSYAVFGGILAAWH